MSKSIYFLVKCAPAIDLEAFSSAHLQPLVLLFSVLVAINLGMQTSRRATSGYGLHARMLAFVLFFSPTI